MKLYVSDYFQNKKNTLYPHEIEITKKSDLEYAVSRDHMASRMKDGKRGLHNFLKCDCIMFDVDNTHSEDESAWLSEGDISEALPVNCVLVRSRNYMKEKRKTDKEGNVTIYPPRPKWHVYCPLKRPISTIEVFNELMNNILAIFPFIDSGAMDGARFFYGVENPHIESNKDEYFIDEYFDSLGAEELRNKQVLAITSFALNIQNGFYEKKTSEVVKTVCEFLGMHNPLSEQPERTQGEEQKTEQEDSSVPDWLANIEQKKRISWVEAWAKKYGVQLGKRYQLKEDPHKGAIAICVTCPWENEHSMDGAENQSVILIETNGTLGYLCRHSAHVHTLNWKKYRERVEADAIAKGLVEDPAKREAVNVTAENGIMKPSKTIQRISTISASDLVHKEIPDINWIVKDMLPEGIMILSAPPKSYKSYMILALCLKVCAGNKFLEHATTKCNALYLDLESGERRPRDRIIQILSGETPPDNLKISTSLGGVEKIEGGFVEQMELEINEDPELKLIVVDVLQKIRPASKKHVTAYEMDYQIFSEVKKLVDKHEGLCVVLITHDKKMRESDWINNATGSIGQAGSADVLWNIEKERDSDEAVLHITGRDIDSQDLQLKFNKDSMRWEYLGTQAEISKKAWLDDYANDPIVRTIKKALEKENPYVTTLQDMIDDSVSEYDTDIEEDTAQIGRKLKKYKSMLEFDGITFTSKKRGSKARQFTFKKKETIIVIGGQKVTPTK